jgi:hypothetical protein
MRLPPQASLLLVLWLIGLAGPAMVVAAPAGPDHADWAARIEDMDRALQRDDTRAAEAAWREAYVSAHVGRGWPGMIAVGDAGLRLGAATGAPAIYEPRARRAYLTALLRARRQASLDGVLAAGARFDRLGDREVVRRALAVAAGLAARSGDGAAQQRVQAFPTR